MSAQAELEANKMLAREYIQRVFNEHRPDLSTEYVTDDVVWHGGILGDIAGAGNVGDLLSAFIGAQPACAQHRMSRTRPTSWCATPGFTPATGHSRPLQPWPYPAACSRRSATLRP